MAFLASIASSALTDDFVTADMQAQASALAADFQAEQAAGKIHGIAPAFHVQINGTMDGLDLGWWSKCDGLKVSWEFHQVTTGDYPGSKSSIFPKSMSFSNVKLTRGLTRYGWSGPSGSGGVLGWLRKVAGTPPIGTSDGTYNTWSADVTLYDTFSSPVATWTLRNVFPVSWTGPTLDAESKNVATEVLELTYDTFLDPPNMP